MFSVFLTPALMLLSLTSAFPSLQLEKRLNVVPFNAAQQYVSNQGEHAFIAPGKGDSRSPCPALNVLANHGYIPRNGHPTLLQVDSALTQVFGIAPDLASVLSLIFLGTTRTGDTYDIGAFPSSFDGVTAYQFIQTYGIGTINAADPMKQICQNYNAINGSNYHTSDPFSSGGAGNDELFFRAFANKSAEYPLGSLDAVSKLSMLAMTSNGDGTFTRKTFYNAIPDNWYKSNDLAQLTVPLFASDIVLEESYGCLFGLGSNYSNYNMAMVTNGAYTNEDLQDSSTNLCFLVQAAPFVLPALAQLPNFSASTRQSVASAVSDFKKGTQSLDCSAHVLKSMNMPLVGNILGLTLA